MVDELDNKSGRRRNEDFPKLIVKEPSYVYFDSKKTANGAYGRESFYFKIEPFSIRNLRNIKPSDLTLPGEMFYGNIFPNIKQVISLNEDLTLGADKIPAMNNSPAYAGIGKFNGELNLSEKGLFPNGELSFLTTKISHSEVIYLPKQVLGTADTLIMSKDKYAGTEFPGLYIGKPKINWLPYADTMIINKQGVVNVFEDRMKLDGEMTLTSKGLSSEGKLYNDYVYLESKLFKYKSEIAEADSAKIVLNDPVTGNKMFKVDTSAISFNIYDDTAILQPAEGQYVKLEAHKYLADSEKLSWDGASRTLTLENDSKNGILNSQIPVEDSLLIEFKTAILNVNSNVLAVSGIEGVKVADTDIIPENGKLTITPSTRIDSLKNAKIKISEVHQLENANIQVISSDKFEGNAQYIFQPPKMDKQNINFDIIKTIEDVEVGKKGKRIRKGFYTVANTNIEETQNFKLNPLVQYKGVVSLDSRKDSLLLDGFGKLQISSGIKTDWYKFTEEINPENITIDMKNPIGESKDSLQIGLSFSAFDYTLYPSFLSEKTSAKDFTIFDSRGKFNYLAEENVYQVGDSGRITYDNSVGQLLILDDVNNTISGNGKLKFYEDFGLLDCDIAGSFTHNITDSTTTFDDLIFALDFSLDEKLFEAKQLLLDGWAADNKEINYPKTNFDKALPHLFNEEKAAKVLDDLEGKEYFERPDEDFNLKLFLVNVDMVWDTLNSSFRSVGDFGLSYVGAKPINSVCSGFVEFAPRSSGTQMNIYLEFPDAETGGRAWIYYNYKNGILEINSSDIDFNQKIESIKETKKLITDKKTNQTFQYALGSMNKRNNFVVRMRETDPMPKED